MLMSPAYNYYSAAVYAPKAAAKYSSHKTSELRAVCNRIVKSSIRSPLFKVNVNRSMQNYAVGIKSAALNLNSFTTSLSDENNKVFSKMTAESDSPDVLDAQVITDDYDRLPESLAVRVDSLASPQVNQSKSLSSEGHSLPTGIQSFQIRTGGHTFNFNIRVNPEDTDEQIQSRLASFINRADTGVEASAVSRAGRSTLTLTASEEGTESAEDGLKFSITDIEGSSLINALGLDSVTKLPGDAVFSINNQEKTSSSNSISVNRMVEIDLKKISSNPVTITFRPDADSIVETMKDFADSYNDLVDAAKANESSQRGARRLLREVESVTSRYHSALEAAGLDTDDQGYMVTDASLLMQSAVDGSIKDLFSGLSEFQRELVEKTGDISMDPMNYVDKTVVTYPDPKRVYPNPYMPSMYTGMLYNQYC